ncbi:MAG: TerD family protein, partial [Telluria sp.]
MDQLSRGQRLPLATVSGNGRVVIALCASGVPLDFACFGLDAGGKLLGEPYMTFFNQPASPCGGVAMQMRPDGASFAIDTARLPDAIDQLVITASVDGAGTLAQLGACALQLGDAARFPFAGADFAQERAAMLGNLYRKDGQWRFMAVGQGFNGGLDALVAHFGGAVADAAPASATQPPHRISLEKRIQSEAPQLVSLVKHAGVSLAKVGLSAHRARVALVLDISGSMTSLYNKGLVQKFADRILALGCKFDD